MSTRQSRNVKRLVQAGLAALMTAGAVVSFAPPASAADILYTSKNVGCVINNRDVNFTLTLRYENKFPLRFSVDQVQWSTSPSFTPSRLTISLRERNGSATPLIRAWGGTASTLHDVGATGNTGSNWEQATHASNTYKGVYSRVYLNADTYCDTAMIPAPSVVIG